MRLQATLIGSVAVLAGCGVGGAPTPGQSAEAAGGEASARRAGVS